jgi:hypothetical protein
LGHHGIFFVVALSCFLNMSLLELYARSQIFLLLVLFPAFSICHCLNCQTVRKDSKMYGSNSLRATCVAHVMPRLERLFYIIYGHLTVFQWISVPK